MLKRFVAITLIFYSFSAYSATVLDQFFIPDDHNLIAGIGVFVDPPWEGITLTRAQTFTVGVSGDLASVDVLVSESLSNADLKIEIWDASSLLSGATGSPLATGWLLAEEVPPSPETFNTVGFGDAAPSVFAGQELAIVFHTDSIIGAWSIGGESDDQATYLGGTGLYKSSDRDWTVESADFGFKTYVSIIPIPAAVWLFGSGLLGLIGLARRKKS